MSSVAEFCSFSQLPITPPPPPLPPRGATFAWTAARRRLVSRAMHCCDNCVGMLANNLPHKPVKICCFFDGEGSTPNYTRHLRSNRYGCGTHRQTDRAGRMLGTQAELNTWLVAFSSPNIFKTASWVTRCVIFGQKLHWAHGLHGLPCVGWGTLAFIWCASGWLLVLHLLLVEVLYWPFLDLNPFLVLVLPW